MKKVIKNEEGGMYVSFLLKQEAEKMVAYLQDGGVDDEGLAAKIVPKPTALSITHEAAFKWFYKDPQGEIQGEQILNQAALCFKNVAVVH